MKKILFLLLAVLLASGGCTKKDLDAARADEAVLLERISTLEEWQKMVNADIRSLQSIATAMENRDYVAGITALADGSGYVIDFVKSGSVTVRKGDKGDTGEKGETGYAPSLGVKPDDVDGVYYWTLDGQWLPGNDGNKLRVTGGKGETGDAGVTPQVRINGGGEWETSTDGGTSWTPTGVNATGRDGEDGKTPISDISPSLDGMYVTITLSDLSTMTFPTRQWADKVNGELSDLTSQMTAFQTLIDGKSFITSVGTVAATAETGGRTGQQVNYVTVDDTGNTTATGSFIIYDGPKGDTGATGPTGRTPAISATQEADGKWYWTVDGAVLEVNGNKVPTQGTDATAPQLRLGSALDATANIVGGGALEATAVYLSVDGGTAWHKVSGEQGDKGSTGATGPQGDKGETGDAGQSFFAGVDHEDVAQNPLDVITFNTADGSSFTVPRYKAFSIGTDAGNNNAALSVYMMPNQIELDLPVGFKESDYTAIMAQVISDRGTSTDIKTRAATDDTSWTVTVEKPTFNADGACNNDATVTVTPPADIAAGETAVLEVTLVGNDGGKTVATRALTYTPKVGDFYCRDNTGKGYFLPGNTEIIVGHTCVGIVFYLGQHEKDDADYSATGIGQEKCHGYVVALTDLETGERLNWEYKNGTYDQSVGTSTDETDWNGYNNTQKIKKFVEDNSGWRMYHFPAANGCLLYGTENSLYDWQKDYAAPSNSSGWFFPSAGQLMGMYKYSHWSKFLIRLGDALGNDYIKWFSISWFYWSSTETSDNDKACLANFYTGSVGKWRLKGSGLNARAICAF